MSTTISHESESVIQAFDCLAPVRIGLDAAVCHKSSTGLNRMLLHTMALRDLYKKAHWQTSGMSFFELHVLFDKHYNKQLKLMDSLAERVQTLGGMVISTACGFHDDMGLNPAPRGREGPIAQMKRIADAHEALLIEARPLARQAAADGDEGTSDILVSELAHGQAIRRPTRCIEVQNDRVCTRI